MWVILAFDYFWISEWPALGERGGPSGGGGEPPPCFFSLILDIAGMVWWMSVGFLAGRSVDLTVFVE